MPILTQFKYKSYKEKKQEYPRNKTVAATTYIKFPGDLLYSQVSWEFFFM